MTLILSLRNLASLDNGGPVRVEFKRRGAVIGRSPTIDWTLPDPSNTISSRHCEVRFEDEAYILRDTSTNGTQVNGRPVSAGHRLATGDVIAIGHYEIAVQAPDVGAPPPEETPGWDGWNSIGKPVGESDAGSGWGKPKPRAPLHGDGPLGESWAPPVVAPGPAPAAPNPSAAPAPDAGWSAGESSAWSSAPDPGTPSPASRDIWGEMAQSNAVDWSRSGFGLPATEEAPVPLGLAGQDPVAALGGPLAPRQPVAAPPPAADPAAPTAAVSPGDLARVFGLNPGDLRQGEEATLSAVAGLLHALVAGLVVMLEARSRAKAQLGAQGTALQFDGNNPLKFARTAEQALVQMLNPPERGFMTAERAVEDAFIDLQSHQMATLKAMQGALRETLARFSPQAIGTRFQASGLLAQVLPAARDAALWRAYVKEFSGVSQGSDEAFMDVFAREFRKAYEEESHRQR